MGNFCGPRKINFVKPKTFANYKYNNFDKEHFNVCKRNSHNSETKSTDYSNLPIKDKIFESDKSHSLFFAINDKFIPRSGSHDSNLVDELDDNFNNEENCYELSLSSVENNLKYISEYVLAMKGSIVENRHISQLDENLDLNELFEELLEFPQSHYKNCDEENTETDGKIPSKPEITEPNVSTIQEEMCNYSSDIVKQRFEKRFKEICLEIPNHSPINIQEVTSLLEDATRSSLASLVDLKNREGHSAVSKAIIRNDVNLLRALLKFMPDFPDYVAVQNMNMPLVQLAAQQNPLASGAENILSVILKRWIDDSSYFNVASRNIITLNSESQDLYKFIIDLKRENYHKSTQYTNLILLFKLFLKLFPESLVIQQKYPDIYRLCQNQYISKKIETCRNEENWLELEDIFQLNVNQ